MKNKLIFHSVATIYNSRVKIEDDHWGDIISEIVLEDSFPEECLYEIDSFSHAEILFYLDQAEEEKEPALSRHLRENLSWPKVGIFAQRNKDRPNHIGLTNVRIIRRDGRSLYVRDLDAVNGTPVLDIKPVFAEFLPHGEVRQPEWSHELMKVYWDKKEEKIDQ